MKRIYLDNAATTPLDPRVAKTMREFESEFFGNPNSTHREGQQARGRIDTARAVVAKFINAKPQEIIFTSGATEANNLAVQGVVNHAIYNRRILKPHIVTTKLEHQSVYNVVKELENRGVISATFVSPNKEGLITAADVKKAIKKNTVLVSVIFVSNEIGSILPIREISRIIKDSNLKPQTSSLVFHVDAVQAARFHNCNVEKLGCDLLTLSAHKFYGPKGIGALYVRSGTKLKNLMFGGAQEYGLRPGTQNTSGIIGFGKTIELLGSLERRQKIGLETTRLRDRLIKGLLEIGQVELNGPIGELRTPDNVNILVYGVDQDSLIAALDLSGISASTGSACVSGSSAPSHVIASLGKVGFDAAAIVRFTLGRETTQTEIEHVIKTFKTLISKLRHEKK
jgi:cysteine desulfurase